MTVAELIAELSALPQGAELDVWDPMKASWMPLEAIDAAFSQRNIRIAHRTYIYENGADTPREVAGLYLGYAGIRAATPPTAFEPVKYDPSLRDDAPVIIRDEDDPN